MTYDGRGLKFGTVAEQYDQFRPGPPTEALEIAGDLAGLKVLEVGAGTGKLTRFLLGLGAQVSVIEPDDAMRAVLTRRSPKVEVLLGRRSRSRRTTSHSTRSSHPQPGTGSLNPMPPRSLLGCCAMTAPSRSGGTESVARSRGCLS